MTHRTRQLLKRLGENNISALYAETGQEALQMVMSMIPERSVVGFGDSLTLRQIGVVDALEEGDYTFLNPWRSGTSVEENVRLKKQALTADVFVTGTNALTLDGKIVNVPHATFQRGFDFAPIEGMQLHCIGRRFFGFGQQRFDIKLFLLFQHSSLLCEI